MSKPEPAQKKVRTLSIPDVPVDVLAELEARGKQLSPAVRRNDLIIHALRELAKTGRVEIP